MKTISTLHTPGPWSEVSGLEKYNDWCIHAQGKKICQMPDNNKETKDNVFQNLANAKLIAAAPDLLEAVKATKAFFDDMPKGQFAKITCDIGLMNEMFLSIEQSLKKATK
jgi:hypothetical protein